jgi:tRNA threonylcarbamoyl adenosine modification protein (Sua5/YciO/YrdC/YwlC family)
MAVDIFNKKSVEKLYTLKKTSKLHLFSCICYNFSKISEYAFVSTTAYRIMNHLFPGPYTFILTGKSVLPKLTLSKRKTIGVRMPDAAIPKAIYAACKNPFLTCSTKLGEEEFLNDPHEINDRFGHQIDVVVDGGDVPYNPSSIISLEGDVPVIIREGSGDLSYFG